MKKLIFAVVLLLGLSLCVVADSGPQITLQPQNYCVKEYSTAIYTVKAEGENLHCTWYLEFEGVTYNISDNTNPTEPWEAYAGSSYGGNEMEENTFIWFFNGIEAGLDGARIWCVIEDGHYDIASESAIITVGGDALPPQILSVPSTVTAYCGQEVELRCVAASASDAQLEYLWYRTDSGKLQDIYVIMPEETSDFLICDSTQPGTQYYVCYVTTTDGGRAYSSVIQVTILEEPEEELHTEPTQQPTEPEENPQGPLVIATAPLDPVIGGTQLPAVDSSVRIGSLGVELIVTIVVTVLAVLLALVAAVAVIVVLIIVVVRIIKKKKKK